MTLDTDASNPTGIPSGPQQLHPAIIKAWYLSGLITLVLVLGGAAGVELFWAGSKSWWPVPNGTLTGVVSVIMVWLELWYPRRAWRAWSWELREHDVLLRFGIFWQTTRSVPRLRIQHVDVSRDPFDRMLGLASVTLYTAGSGSDDAEIPGLAPFIAEALREELLIHKDAAQAPADEAGDLDGQGQLFDEADGWAPPEAPQAPLSEPHG